MKVCIYGAGAIGGFIGARLAGLTDVQVSAVARGATLAALREHGWRLRSGGQLHTLPGQFSDEPAALGVQDLVVIAVKGPALVDVAERIAPLIGADTIVLPAMNGVPWWFAQHVAALGGLPLQAVDQGGRVTSAIAGSAILGCVVHAAASMPEPGLVDHKVGEGLIIGEPGGGDSARAQRVAKLLQRAGFEASVSADVRKDIWYKLWGNLTVNPVSAITGATADQVLDDEQVRAFCTAAMAEAALVGGRIGCAIAQSPEERHTITRRIGAFRTSMLQDVDAGRAIELDAIVGVVCEIAQRVGVATPNIQALLGLTRLFARVHGLYPPAAAVPAA